MNERMSHQPQPTTLMMAVGQPNIKGYASPSLTPSNNYRAGYHQQQQIVTKDYYKGANNTGGECASLRNIGSSNIQGRRIDSPELKVAVNKDIQDQRPHTAGHPFFGHAAQMSSKQQGITSQNASASYQNPLNMTTHNAKKISQQPHFDFNIKNQRVNATIQYDDKQPTGRQNKGPSKSSHPNQKRKKQQQSRSAPKYGSGACSNIHASIVNTQAQPLINIQIQNTKVSRPSQQPSSITQLRRRADPAKFHSQGGVSGQMSAPVQSKSRSRSLKRKNETKAPQASKQTNLRQQLKPPKQPSGNLNKSTVNQSRVHAGGNEIGYHYENKENQSLNYDEISPSRFNENNMGTGVVQRVNKNDIGRTYFDSDSSLSSPKTNTLSYHQTQKEGAASGQQTGKQQFMDKSSFLRHFSPERPSVPNQQTSGFQSDLNISSSNRERLNNRLRASMKSAEGTTADGPQNNSSKALLSQGSHRIHLKVVDKMLKEKFKHMKAREEAEDLSRRKHQEDQLASKHLVKKAELLQFSQRAANQIQKLNPAKINVANQAHKHKNSQVTNGVQINIQRVGVYKKQRSKSCMNKTDNIFGGLPRSKERQQIIQNLQQLQQNAQPQKEEPQKQMIEAQPKQPTQTKRREKSFVLEMKELKRQCVEELKKDILAGKIEGLPTSSAAAFASNKRQSNLTTITHKKDSKQNQSANAGINQLSRVELNVQQKKKTNSKTREQPEKQQMMVLNNAFTTKIKRFIEKKKKMGYMPKSLEQTIMNEKKMKIQENLEQLFKNIKTKQGTHQRHQSFTFLLKKQQALNIKQQPTNNPTVSPLEGGPQKKLQSQFFSKNQVKNDRSGKIFNYQSEAIYDQENFDGRIDSNSLTPVRTSGKSKNYENDLSIEFQEDYQRIVKSIQQKNPQNVTKGVHLSNSNPPVQNRKKGDPSGQADSLSLDVSSIGQRDSSLKHEHRRYKADNKKTSKNKKLVDELEYNRRKRELHRTVINEKVSISSDRNKQRSGSSPHSVPQKGSKNVSTIIPPNSDNSTIEQNVRHHIGGNTEQKRLRSDEGSNSIQLSASTQEYKERIRMLTKEYGPHIERLKQQQSKDKFARVSNTQLLIALHSAAIVIQTSMRNYLTNKGFYAQSNMYIDSSDQGVEEEDDEESKIDSRRQPASMLIANMSPLRVKSIQHKPFQIRQEMSDVRDHGSQFYPAKINESEKIIVCSVITSARKEPEPSGQPSSNADDSNNNSFKTTANYIPLRTKAKVIPELPMTEPATAQVSEFNTAIKTLPEVEIKKPQDQDQDELKIDLKPQVARQETSASKEPDSSSRRNLVPQLNLSSLAFKEQKEEQKHESSSNRLFDRHPFQKFQEHHPLQDFNLEMYPQMVQLRENAIKMQEDTEKKLLKQMFKSNQYSPRTYDQKRRDLETWVTKQKEEVKKTKKVFEEEWTKTQHIIAETQKNQDNMKRLMGEQTISTHRSKHMEPLHQGEDQLSHMHRGESHRAHSSRPDNKSFLESLADQKNEENQAVVIDTSRKTSSKQSYFDNNASIESKYEVKIPVQAIQDHHEEEKVIQQQEQILQEETFETQEQQQQKIDDDLHYARKQEELRKEVQLISDQISNDEFDVESEKFIFKNNYKGNTKEVEGFSDEEESNDKNDSSGLIKGLSRTKNSLQLHRELDEKEDVEPKQVIVQETHIHLMEDDEERINSDIRRNINDESNDEDQVPSPEVPNKSPDLQDQIKRDNFFIKDFEISNPINILSQLNIQKELSDLQGTNKSNEFRPQNTDEIYLDSDLEVELQQIQQKEKSYENENPPLPPSPSPENLRPQKPTDLEDINVDIGEFPNELSHAPVSPASNTDVVSETVISAGGALDTRIITGGGSLTSTLSAGEGGNQDLIRIIQEVQNDKAEQALEEEQKVEGEKLIETITEDIYSKIMEELKMDMEILLLNDQRVNHLLRAENQNSRTQQLSESGRFLIFDRRGISTDLFAIERYVEEVLQEVLCDKDKFMHNIMEPISKNPREVLNQLQNSEIGSYEHFEQHFPSVLPLDTYLKLERRRKDLRNSQQENVDLQQTQVVETRNFLAECEHIHNKVLFDCINDSLLQFKPYAKDGSPLPWSRQNRRLKPTEDFSIEETFEIVKHDLFRWAIMQAGTLPRREFVFGGQFDEELFAEIREKKLATLLAREMIENEPKWLNYEFEEAQVKIDIGDMILEQLVTETISLLNERMGGQTVTSADIASAFSSRVLI